MTSTTSAADSQSDAAAAPADASPRRRQRPIRRFRIGSNVTLQIALGVVLFSLVNYLSFRHYKRWDLTANRDYTLHSTTIEYLENLDKKAKIIVAFPRSAELAPDLAVMAEEYKRHAGDRIALEFVDPALNPSRAEELRSSYGVAFDRGNTIIVDVEGRTKFIAEEDLASFERDDSGFLRMTDFHGEDALTSALIAVSEKNQRRLYLLMGKGQLRRTPAGDASSLLRDFARRQNVDLKPLNLADVARVPPDADGLVVIAPQIDFTESEMRMLVDYWKESRGALLILLDPHAETPRLHGFLADHGIEPRNDRVLFAESTPAGPVKHYAVQSNFVPGSPITRALRGITTEFARRTQSLALAERSDALRRRNIVVQPLLEATPKYWGETRYFQDLPSFDERDHGPPIFVAASAELGAVSDPAIRIDSSRMVIVANPSLLDPDVLLAQNYDFIANSINWMIDREELVGIPPKPKEQFSISVTEEQRTRIFWLVAGVLPALVLCLGVFVWSVRRA